MVSLKMSVVFCVLYFFTVAWSIGLHYFQIHKLVILSMMYDGNNEKGIIPSKDIYNYLSKTVGRYGKNVKQLKNLQIVLPKGFVVDNKTMPEFLIMLADSEKDSDNWNEEGLTTYEVKLFVGMFNVQDKNGHDDGLLTVAELNELFDDKLNLPESIKSHIKEDLIGQKPMNVLLYLELILKHKYYSRDDILNVEYQHLNEAQINKCLALYNSYEKHLDSRERKALFKTLNIVSDEYDYLLDFEHVGPAALELQELLVFLSEYDKNFYKQAPYLTRIKQKMRIFTFYDKNRDGLLDILEFKDFAWYYLPHDKIKAFVMKFFPRGSPPMCAGLFLNIFLYLFPTDYQYY